MKGLFRNFLEGKWRLQKSNYTEVTEPLLNPARGWYKLFTFSIEEEPDFAELAYSLEYQHSLVLVLVDIGSYNNRDLDDEGRNRLREIIRFFVRNDKDVILRVTYDHEGKALEREPSLFVRVQKHMTQIARVLQEFPDSVFVIQGLLVGNWGEMHTSKFLSTEMLEQLAELLWQHRGARSFLAVRRPMYWRALDEKGATDDMGLYDDGIFSSESDLGTYGNNEREMVGWTNAWTREEELDFQDDLCRKVPNGGEVVWGDEYTQNLTQEQILYALRKMHITYLNNAYDARVLKQWKSMVYSGSDVWNGRSLYDYIGAHLGYRFLIKKANLTHLRELEAENLCLLEIEITNIGFANFYQEAAVYLEWTDGQGRRQKKQLACDMREWDSGSTKVVACTISVSESELYISANRIWDDAPILFANGADADGRTLLGSIRKQTFWERGK